MQSSYTAGFVPWTFWCEDYSANELLGRSIGFFQTWGFGRRDELFEVFEPWESSSYRPACPRCKESSTANIGSGDFECLSCGLTWPMNSELRGIKVADAVSREGDAATEPAASTEPPIKDVAPKRHKSAETTQEPAVAMDKKRIWFLEGLKEGYEKSREEALRRSLMAFRNREDKEARALRDLSDDHGANAYGVEQEIKRLLHR